MSTQILHATPRWSDIAREQFRAVGVAVRREAAIAALLVVGLSVLMLVAIFRARAAGANSGNMNLGPEMLAPVIFLGFLVPLSIWKSEEPSRRFYHWSMPVDRGVHTLTKSAAGWLWFMIAAFVYLLWGMIVVAIVGGGMSDGQSEFWQWVQPFTAATVAFLLGSTLVLASDHPWRWAAGIVIGYLILNIAADAAGLGIIEPLLELVRDGRWGLGTAMSGETGIPQQATLNDGRTVRGVVQRPDFGAWLGATLLWLGIGSAGVVAAAYRHQER